ncbi:hypothetical protein K388_05050 [Streptomyces sp. KhCrAH-43]|uniref:hypothetical protein n=1 Tax=unclassified Streptomyces TaxID=2593676 RepID=UPI0003765209|nr:MULTISPECIES: hypothetical protein [unclassified Streptomyces]MYX67316.1 hypothetical protein [Streptomyces sp. SID8373]RAJ54916.1 hypothetical protein K388_05050 [Streptomyces sp. KhCrAH-43]
MSSFYADISPQVYEITWQAGHVETVIAHQVAHSSQSIQVSALANGEFATKSEGQQRITFHAEVDGRWTLQLSAVEADIRTIRNVTNGEQLPGGTR